MAGRHSFTVQIDPSLPGHVAVALSDPAGQTYAGFGPEHHLRFYDKGRFDVHPVERGHLPPPDHSSATGGRTFTFPVSEAQANAAHEEIRKIQSETPQYDARLGFADPQVCSTIASRIMKAAGLGNHLYTVPQVDLEYLSDIADTLASNPRAKVAVKTGLPIPDELRDIQPDYAGVGTGYDTPSERLGHAPSAMPDNAMTPGISSSNSGVAPRPTRYLARITGTSEAIPFDTGAPPAPYMPPVKNPLSPSPSATFAERFAGRTSPDNANRAQHAGGPPGLVSGQSMPAYPASPWLFGLPDRPAASGDDMDDWYTRWVKPLIQ
jgi:hypothetical protein